MAAAVECGAKTLLESDVELGVDAAVLGARGAFDVVGAIGVGGVVGGGVVGGGGGEGEAVADVVVAVTVDVAEGVEVLDVEQTPALAHVGQPASHGDLNDLSGWRCLVLPQRAHQVSSSE